MEKYYKAIELGENGQFKTLFHSNGDGRRILPRSTWIKAVQRVSSEGGGTKYRTGFHMLKSLDEIKEYSRKFQIKSSRRIISVWARGVRRKKHSTSPVLLAKEIFIPYNCEVYSL